MPRDPNFISSVYHYHKFQKILVGDINDVEQRAVYQNEVDYMYGMQWPSSYDGFFFRDHKKMKLGVYNRRSENLNQKYLIYFLFNYCFVFLLRLNIKNIIVRVVGGWKFRDDRLSTILLQPPYEWFIYALDVLF